MMEPPSTNSSFQTPCRSLLDTTDASPSPESSCCESPPTAAVNPISHIRVVARIRPMSHEEAKRGSQRGIRIQETREDDDSKSCPKTADNTGLLARLRSSFSIAPAAAKDESQTSLTCDDFDEGIVLATHMNLEPNACSYTKASARQSSQMIPTVIVAESSSGTREFEMDAVFGPLSTQQFVYEHSLPNMAQHLFQGYNTTILAYGQTGSGKTYTMGGQKDARTLAGDILSASNSSLDSDENDGIITRAVRDIFTIKQEYEERQYSVHIQLSCLEIYQDELRDLWRRQDPLRQTP